ncbi:MAG: AMP-binding protein, partial [Planctomycetota bacterium]
MASVPTTFPALLRDVVAPRGAATFLPRRRASDPRPVAFGELARDVDALAAALLGGGAGSNVRRGDRVGVIAENRYEWFLCDQAMASLGVVDVPRGSDTTPKEIEFILRHSGCRMAFAEDDKV